ncbi:hypothetical protein EGW08_022129 [Elysia chlorotica]|uniref:Reverse transcriptase RNase H-like domain-containing protein n=1 Tax=Elysia chlorotica TaxID=188477 RepID=A0A3S0Z3V9_ELYCH|nr:hypothetical protein EGW08_022129 [Elysia chlorotica]
MMLDSVEQGPSSSFHPWMTTLKIKEQCGIDFKIDTVKITLREDARPYNVVSLRRIPFSLQESVKQELAYMEQAGIIEKTIVPTDWCAPVAPVEKKNGHLRVSDASSFGIGGALLKLDGTKIMPIAFALRTLSATEQNYAPIEKECLASVRTCEKVLKYLNGLKSLTLEADHKLLVPIFMKKAVDKTPIRCQRLLIRMMKFNPTVTHKAGKDLVIKLTHCQDFCFNVKMKQTSEKRFQKFVTENKSDCKSKLTRILKMLVSRPQFRPENCDSVLQEFTGFVECVTKSGATTSFRANPRKESAQYGHSTYKDSTLYVSSNYGP